MNAELSVERAAVRPDRVLPRGTGRSPISRADRSVASRRSTASSASLGGSSISPPARASPPRAPAPPRRRALEPRRCRRARRAPRGRRAAPPRPRRRGRAAQRTRASTIRSHAWCTVATSSRRKRSAVGELVLGLDQVALGGQHRAERRGCVRPEPAPAGRDGATATWPSRRGHGPRPASLLDGDERERRAGEYQARGGALDVRVLERPHRHRPRLVQLTGEEQSAGARGAGGQDHSSAATYATRPRAGRRAPAAVTPPSIVAALTMAAPGSTYG